MKKTLKLIIPALVLCVAIVLSVCLPSFTSGKKQLTTAQINENATANVVAGTPAATFLSSTDKQEAEVKYAFGTTVTEKPDGTKEFKFTYEGKEYKNAYERVLAEDGFLYGYDWNWFGSASQALATLGYEEVNDVPSAYRPAYVTRALYNMKAVGRNAMACWIGPKGCFTFDHDTGYVTGLDATFKENLVYLLESCRETETAFVPCLLTHWYLDSYYQDPAKGRLAREQREFYLRFYHDLDAQKEWLEHGVAEMCKILADYQDVVAAVALTVEQGTSINDLNTGFLVANSEVTWESFATMHNNMHDVVKTYMPNVYTSVEDNGGQNLTIQNAMYKYNDLKVDLICPQQYSPSGTSFQDQENYIKTRSGYLGEFNYHWGGQYYENVTIEYLDTIMLRHYKDLVQKGLSGAFHFVVSQQFEKDPWSYFMSSNMDEYETMRNFLVPLSYIIHDLKQEYRGTAEKEKPILLYNNDNEKNYWIPVRGAVNYILERSEKGGEWQVICDQIDPLEYTLTNGLIMYQDTIERISTFQYRVTAVMDDGTKIVSDPGNVMTKFIPTEFLVDSEGNYDGGFEKGDASFISSDEQYLANGKSSNGWVVAGNATRPGKVTDEIINDTGAYEGNKYLLIDSTRGYDYGYSHAYAGQCKYYLTIPGSQKFELSEMSRDGLSYFSVSVHDAVTDATLAVIGNYQFDPAQNPEYIGQWNRTYNFFTSPDHGKVYVKLMNGASGNKGHVLIDNISIKDAK